METKTVEVNGKTIIVNIDYMRSWDGIRRAAKLMSDMEQNEKLALFFEHYEAAIVNIDEVLDSFGDDPNFADVADVLSTAIKDSMGKN